MIGQMWLYDLSLKTYGYFHRVEKEVQWGVLWVDLMIISFVCDNLAFHK